MPTGCGQPPIRVKAISFDPRSTASPWGSSLWASSPSSNTITAAQARRAGPNRATPRSIAESAPSAAPGRGASAPRGRSPPRLDRAHRPGQVRLGRQPRQRTPASSCVASGTHRRSGQTLTGWRRFLGCSRGGCPGRLPGLVARRGRLSPRRAARSTTREQNHAHARDRRDRRAPPRSPGRFQHARPSRRMVGKAASAGRFRGNRGPGMCGGARLRGECDDDLIRHGIGELGRIDRLRLGNRLRFRRRRPARFGFAPSASTRRPIVDGDAFGGATRRGRDAAASGTGLRPTARSTVQLSLRPPAPVSCRAEQPVWPVRQAAWVGGHLPAASSLRAERPGPCSHIWGIPRYRRSLLGCGRSVVHGRSCSLSRTGPFPQFRPTESEKIARSGAEAIRGPSEIVRRPARKCH